MELKERFTNISQLVDKYLPLVSQRDMNAIVDNKFNHRWYDQLSDLTNSDFKKFDSNYDFKLLDCSEWTDLINKIQTLCSFNELEFTNLDIKVLGNSKKQHELKSLFQLLKNRDIKKVVDFGGGVGNLANFLVDHINCDVCILEKNEKLISKGVQKASKRKNDIKYIHTDIGNDSSDYDLSNYDSAIGLHTCGNFATDMIRECARHSINHIYNFGCCYSKIHNQDYNLSQASNKKIVLNDRALSCATLGLNNIPSEFYDYRQKILDYKFSFYHLAYLKFGNETFFPMSNSRRSLYQKDFYEFINQTLKKYIPSSREISQNESLDFYNSEKNQELLKYFQNYYSIYRYLSPLIEAYILCDRALWLQEKGYKVEITEVFNKKISPRNKLIYATKH